MGLRLPGEMEDEHIIRRGPRDAEVLGEVVVGGRRVAEDREDLRGEAAARLHRHRAGADLVVQGQVLRLRVRRQHSDGEHGAAARGVEDKEYVLDLDRAELFTQHPPFVLEAEDHDELDGGQERPSFRQRRVFQGR